MLQSRFISAIILIPLVIAAIFCLPLFAFATIIIVICMIAAWEWGRLAGVQTYHQLTLISFFCGLILFLMFFSFSLKQFQIQRSLWLSVSWWISALILIIFYPCSARLWRSSCFLRLLFGILTIMSFFEGMIALRQYRYDTDHFIGAWWLLFVTFLVWSADSGAYIVGKFFGRHKLVPKISPGKTWEGLLGGLLFSIVIAWLFIMLAPFLIKSSTLIFYAIVITLVSVLGDLTESMFKREAGIKDSSNLIPGHGGILDRIDSLTSAVPVLAYLLLEFYTL